jgi:hypothetical protein
MYVSERSVEVAQMRQEIREEDRSVRAPVEATMRSVKRGLKGGPGQAAKGDKLPTRGLERARMVMSGATLMVNMRLMINMRHLCRWRKQKREEASPKDRSGLEKLLFLVFLWALGTARQKVRRQRAKVLHRHVQIG